jgi:hypothetical protein
LAAACDSNDVVVRARPIQQIASGPRGDGLPCSSAVRERAVLRRTLLTDAGEDNMVSMVIPTVSFLVPAATLISAALLVAASCFIVAGLLSVKSLSR